jgi:hypothetical protein
MNSLVYIGVIGIIFMTIFTQKAPKSLKSNPRMGGWSAGKIKKYNKKTGSNLRPGVKGDPKTLDDFRRKGSWATRHYKRKGERSGLNMAPLRDEKGNLTAFSTQALAWGESPPGTREEQKRLVKLGEDLLEVYRTYKDRGSVPESVRKKFRRKKRSKV